LQSVISYNIGTIQDPKTKFNKAFTGMHQATVLMYELSLIVENLKPSRDWLPFIEIAQEL